MSLLDEPTEGVQPENIDRMATLVAQAGRRRSLATRRFIQPPGVALHL